MECTHPIWSHGRRKQSALSERICLSKNDAGIDIIAAGAVCVAQSYNASKDVAIEEKCASAAQKEC